MREAQHTGELISNEDLERFFEQSACGFLIADPQGIILRSNTKLSSWIGVAAGELKGKRFSDLLTIGGKIYYETHLWPLLRMQGFFDEVLVELNNSAGEKLRVLVNAIECRDKNNKPTVIHYTLSKASDRLQYEQNLQQAKMVAEKELLTEKEAVVLREQLIAVLGHDLRNPLSAITMAVELLQDSKLRPEDNVLLATLKRSSYRMAEIVANVMDFARTRLGEGLIITRQDVLLEPILQQVVEELKLIFSEREIITVFELAEPVYCDPHRIAQLLSNLLANALTHGAVDKPVSIHALHKNGIFELSIINSGTPIPEILHQRLFTPFTREGDRQSQNGLGLGLYISAEIARAHNATLTCTSNIDETKFTFHMAS
jgi:sigma-B regulation protein RsbU (phosphoserine phosphatase)